MSMFNIVSIQRIPRKLNLGSIYVSLEDHLIMYIDPLDSSKVKIPYNGIGFGGDDEYQLRLVRGSLTILIRNKRYNIINNKLVMKS